MSSATDETHRCPISWCPAKSMKKSSLFAHIESKHIGQLFTCPNQAECGFYQTSYYCYFSSHASGSRQKRNGGPVYSHCLTATVDRRHPGGRFDYTEVKRRVGWVKEHKEPYPEHSTPLYAPTPSYPPDFILDYYSGESTPSPSSPAHPSHDWGQSSGPVVDSSWVPFQYHGGLDKSLPLAPPNDFQDSLTPDPFPLPTDMIRQFLWASVAATFPIALQGTIFNQVDEALNIVASYFPIAANEPAPLFLMHPGRTMNLLQKVHMLAWMLCIFSPVMRGPLPCYWPNQQSKKIILDHLTSEGVDMWFILALEESSYFDDEVWALD